MIQAKFNAYALITRAIDEGIAYGWNRAHKHTNKPTPEAIKEEIGNAVISELCEIIDFNPVE